jgi:hypothetical protein
LVVSVDIQAFGGGFLSGQIRSPTRNQFEELLIKFIATKVNNLQKQLKLETTD